MDFDRCKKCGRYDEISHHRCPPKWDIMLWDDAEDIREAYASDAKSAAEEYVSLNLENLDYPERIDIGVRAYGAENWKRYRVHIQSVPSFTATEVA